MAEYVPGAVLGLSSLRGTEDAAKAPPPLSEEAKKREEYLKRYLDGGDAEKTNRSGQRKRRKRRKEVASEGTALRLVDEDVDWRSAPSSADVMPRFGAADENNEDGPVIENVEEIRHELKLEESRRRYHKDWAIEAATASTFTLDSNGKSRAGGRSDKVESPRQRGSSAHAQQQHNGADKSAPSHGSGTQALGRRHDSDNDESPARRGRGAQGRRHDSDDDEFPARRSSGAHAQGRRHDSDDDESPARRSSGAHAQGRRHDSDDDESPARRSSGAHAQGRHHDSDDDESPARRSSGAPLCQDRQHPQHEKSAPQHRKGRQGRVRRYDSVEGDAPPRRSKNASNRGLRCNSNGNTSPSRRGSGVKAREMRHNSDSDASPPRRSSSGQVRGHHHDSDGDKSPPRHTSGAKARGMRHDSDNDASSPHRGRHRQEQARGHGSDDDASPPRRGSGGPLRGVRHRVPDGDDDAPSWQSKEHKPHQGPRHNAVGGLISAHEMNADIARQKADEKRRVHEMDSSVSGRGADVRYRLEGKLVSREEYTAAKEKQLAAKQRPPKYLEEDVAWKGGLAQERSLAAAAQEMAREAAKPMQREFDADADRAAQHELRPDDPMAKYFAAKLPSELERAENAGLDKIYGDTLVGKSGFNVPQEVPAHSWLRRGVSAPVNRYGIKPGRHWDGVHRSNGLEKFLFACANRRAAKERDEYLSMVDV